LSPTSALPSGRIPYSSLWFNQTWLLASLKQADHVFPSFHLVWIIRIVATRCSVFVSSDRLFGYLKEYACWRRAVLFLLVQTGCLAILKNRIVATENLSSFSYCKYIYLLGIWGGYRVLGGWVEKIRDKSPWLRIWSQIH
jgi:hypothetical protein